MFIEVLFFCASRDKKSPRWTKVEVGRIDLLSLQKKLVPEMIDLMEKRYRILYHIQHAQPIGRRSLMNAVDLSERVLRAEVELLKKQQLIKVESIGMSLTNQGEEVVTKLFSIMNTVNGTTSKEKALALKYGISKVFILPGDCDQAITEKDKLGKKAAEELVKILEEEDILAVTGGSTIRAVANQIQSDMVRTKPNVVVPARGSFGGNVEAQANIICSQIANKFSTPYITLYLPDQLSETSLQLISQEPEIKLALEYLHQSTVVLHGIGDALTMANKRNTDKKPVELLEQEEAIGEAFGAYFNKEGKVVHQLLTVGLQIEQLHNKKHVIAVAGGASKSEAIKAYLKLAPASTILITDEVVANNL